MKSGLGTIKPVSRVRLLTVGAQHSGSIHSSYSDVQGLNLGA